LRKNREAQVAIVILIEKTKLGFVFITFFRRFAVLA
jgi:hypothetical protein